VAQLPRSPRSPATRSRSARLIARPLDLMPQHFTIVVSFRYADCTAPTLDGLTVGSSASIGRISRDAN